jgi:Replication-relaxation
MTAATAYAAVHRYDGAVIERGQRERVVHCAVQPRDLAIVCDVWRYHFLTTDQLVELWWPGASVQAGRRRLVKLFRAGYLDRFRPISRRGSYPWTYHLGADGHRMLVRSGAISRTDRFKARAIYDFGHILHDLQLNGWVLAWRRVLGETLIEWHGETEIHPPTGVRRDPRDPFLQVDFDSDQYAENLRDDRPRLLRPDAIVEVEDSDGGTPLTYFLEFDRTRRVDKNYDKFRRYDCFLNYWWRYADFGGLDDAPWVIFICQDRDHAIQFLDAADRELTGDVSRPWSDDDDYVGRRRIVVCLERSVYEGSPHAWLVPSRPRREWGDEDGERRVTRTWLPGRRPEPRRDAA